MLKEVLNLYRDKFSFDKFYDNLFYNINEWQSEHIQHPNFLRDYPFEKREVVFESQRPCRQGISGLIYLYGMEM